MNTFGKIFRLTSFGESHGVAIGGIIDGVPSGELIDIDEIQHELNRRRPGRNIFVSPRQEIDEIEILSGLFEGKTLGTPIGFLIRNTNQKPDDYENIKEVYRPSHADFTYEMKYGLRDYRGGGRASARETIARVVGGAVAKQILARHGIKIRAYTSSIGNVALNNSVTDYDLDNIDNSAVYCPDPETSIKMEELISRVKAEADSIGGIVTCVIKGVPVGIGNPVFDKLQSRLAAAMMSINAAKGFDYGSGFESSTMRGSQHNDLFISDNGKIHTRTNNSGGIQGGISNGEDIYMRIAFKPTATLPREFPTVDCNGNNVSIKIDGRHDACVVPRAVPIVEAMAAMVILDSILSAKSDKY